MNKKNFLTTAFSCCLCIIHLNKSETDFISGFIHNRSTDHMMTTPYTTTILPMHSSHLLLGLTLFNLSSFSQFRPVPSIRLLTTKVLETCHCPAAGAGDTFSQPPHPLILNYTLQQQFSISVRGAASKFSFKWTRSKILNYWSLPLREREENKNVELEDCSAQ